MTEKEVLKKKNSFDFLNQLMWWKINSNTLENQIQQYKSLKIYESYKGIAAMLIGGRILLSELVLLIQWVPDNNFIISFLRRDFGLVGLFFYLFLAIFVFKGKKWALLIMMVIETINSGFSLFRSSSLEGSFWLMIIFWWSIFMKMLYTSYRVEVERSNLIRDKNKTNNVVEKEVEKNILKKYHFKKVLTVGVVALLLVTISYYLFGFLNNRIDKKSPENPGSIANNEKYFSQKIKCSEKGEIVKNKVEDENAKRRSNVDWNKALDDSKFPNAIGFNMYKIVFYSPKLDTCLTIVYNTSLKTYFIDDILIKSSVGFPNGDHIAEFSKKDKDKFEEFMKNYSDGTIDISNFTL